MATYFAAEANNGASIRLYPNPVSDGDLRLEVTVGATAFRVNLEEKLANNLADALTRFYAGRHFDLIANDNEVAEDLTSYPPYDLRD